MQFLDKPLPPIPPRGPIRVAHVVGQLDTGGMERLLVEFARHTDRARFGLHFISLGGRGTVATELESMGWPVTTLDRPTGIRPSLIFRLATLFRQLKVSVVHTHNIRPLLYGAPAARLAGVGRVVHTRHGRHYAAKPADLRRLRVATRLVDHVISVSDDSTRLAEEVGIAPAKLCTIRNGIDVGRFDYIGPVSEGPAVMVGRLSPEKDPYTLIRAAAIVCAAEPGFRLEIAGAGKCMVPVMDLAKSLGLERRIRFYGEVRDVAGLLARASQYVLPSLSEGISLGLLEAMARGLPVVATGVGGTPEVVEDGRTGWLVAPSSPGELAGGMLRVYRDPAGAREMGRAGHERVRRLFDVRRMVGEYERLYLPSGVERRVAA
jgi:glycosyltransferase involved in cell wall biosynthesis